MLPPYLCILNACQRLDYTHNLGSFKVAGQLQSDYVREVSALARCSLSGATSVLGLTSLVLFGYLPFCGGFAFDLQGSPALGKFYIVTDGGWQVSLRDQLRLPTPNGKHMSNRLVCVSLLLFVGVPCVFWCPIFDRWVPKFSSVCFSSYLLSCLWVIFCAFQCNLSYALAGDYCNRVLLLVGPVRRVLGHI